MGTGERPRVLTTAVRVELQFTRPTDCTESNRAARIVTAEVVRLIPWAGLRVLVDDPSFVGSSAEVPRLRTIIRGEARGTDGLSAAVALLAKMPTLGLWRTGVEPTLEAVGDVAASAAMAAANGAPSFVADPGVLPVVASMSCESAECIGMCAGTWMAATSHVSVSSAIFLSLVTQKAKSSANAD